jgi:hypothetical protein
MSVLDELRTLARQFPHATELAVTPEMVVAFETECARLVRYYEGEIRPTRVFPVIRMRTIDGAWITTKQLPLFFKDKRLTLVGEL